MVTAWVEKGRGLSAPDIKIFLLPLFQSQRPWAGADAEWKIPVIALHSKQDQVVPYKAAESHIANLKAKGANVELGTLDGPKHFDVEAHAVMAGDVLQKRLIKK